MPRKHFYVDDYRWRETLRNELRATNIQTLEDFSLFASALPERDAGAVLVFYIDRLTKPRVKENGRRDGRWIWENWQARRPAPPLAIDHPVTADILDSLQFLIAEYNGLGRMRGMSLVRYGFRGSKTHFERGALNRFKVAHDICTLLTEVLKEKELPD